MPSSTAAGAGALVICSTVSDSQFGLHSLDLLEQLETVELTGDFGFDVPGERTAIPRVKFFKTRSAITTQRLTIPDVLTEEQSLHAVDVENPLGDQHSSLAANPAAIL